jgi:hypothetical protein
METEITVTQKEAFDILRKIIKKTTRPTVKFDGTISLEIGDGNKEYTLVVEGSWVIDSGKKQYYKQNYITLRDEEEIQNFIGVSEITGFDLDTRRFTIVFANNIQIHIMDFDQETKRYFTLTPHVVTEDKILSLNSDYHYSLTPMVDSVLK